MIGVAKNFLKNIKNSYLPINVLLITIAGLYSSEIKNSFLLKLYSFYRAACLTACTFFSIWIIAGMVERGSLVLIEIMGTLLHFSVYLTTCYLLLYFYIKQDHLERILSFMENDFFYSSEPGVYKVTMLDYVNGSKMLTMFWVCWTPFAVLFVSLAPTIGRELPFLVWCFYDCYSAPAFELTVLVEICGQCVIIACFLATDTLFPCFAYMGVGQFRVLACNYRNAFYTVLLKLGVSEEDVLLYSKTFDAISEDLNGQEGLTANIDQLVESKIFDETLFEVFTEYVRRHQLLLKYIKDVDNFFSNYFIVKMGMYVAYVVAIAYLVLVGTDRAVAFSLFTYFLGSIVPTFLFNFFGQLFVDEYNQISMSLYESPWYMGSNRFQKIFLYVQMAANRPITLTAGKIMDMNMETFKGFLKLLMSFITFIRQMSEIDE